MGCSMNISFLELLFLGFLSFPVDGVGFADKGNGVSLAGERDSFAFIDGGLPDGFGLDMGLVSFNLNLPLMPNESLHFPL